MFGRDKVRPRASETIWSIFARCPLCRSRRACACVRGVMWCVVASLSHAAAAVRPPNTHPTPRPRSIRPGGHLVSGVDDGVRAPSTHACTTFASRVPPTTKPLARVRPRPAVRARARTPIVRGGLRCGYISEEYPNIAWKLYIFFLLFDRN